jgi:TolB protein
MSLMWKSILFLLSLHFAICSSAFPTELEVHLVTRTTVKPLYLSQVYSASSDTDKHYCDALRSILERDLSSSGYCSIAPRVEILENAFHFPEVRSNFDLSQWKREKIPYAVAIQGFQNRIGITAFNTENGTSKKYPDIALTGDLDTDRRAIHKAADLLQKDLFGQEGISSLQILYTKRVKNPHSNLWSSEVWISDVDGANARQLTHENSYCLSPLFISKDEFFYVSEKTGQAKIYRASIENPIGKMALDLRGNQVLPAFSKARTQLAFIADIAGRPDLFIQNLDSKGNAIGKARHIFSSPRATQASPTFSPDGKRIAFVSDKDGPPRVYVLDTVKQKESQRLNPRLLTTRNRENTSPSWSPDGKKLSYSAKTDGIRQIWIYDFQTEEEIQLTNTPGNKENAVWAPDSYHLVYNTESDEESELYLIHLNEGEPVLIGKGRFASWEPR